MLVKNQYIMTGMGDPIDISIPAIKVIMDLLGVEDQLKCLKKISVLTDEFLTLLREKNKSKPT